MFEQPPCLDIKSNIKVQVNIITYVCTSRSVTAIINGMIFNTSASDISNVLVECSKMEIKVTLVIFDHGLTILVKYSVRKLGLNWIR